MKKNLLFAFIFLFQIFYCSAQKTPKRELRGAWISTHLSLDWPRLNFNPTPAAQRAALMSILDHHKANGINTIYFQVRNQSDAMYPSPIEPWSNTLTGVQGRDPGWDPLQFVIEETHKRGMELHAWINPYRAVATASQLSSFVPSHVAKLHPEWLLSNGSTITLNPGISEVRDYIMSVITDITQRYDIDGIHFDDYFYPPAPFNDDVVYNADPRGFPATAAGRANWRRDNINLFIQRLYTTLATIKPWVKFGVSPSGIYRNGVSVGGSATAGTEHYSAVYADSKKWLQEGWVDYIAPQVYWHIGFSVADYAKLIPWWNNNAFGRHIYIGMASYKVNMTFGATGNGPTEQAAWKIPTQYPNELRLNRLPEYQNVLGEMHFRALFLMANALGHTDSMRQNIYKRQALLPTMPWRDDTPPSAPTSLVGVKQSDNSYVLNWSNPVATTNEMDKVRQFVIYRSESPVINLEDTANLLNITNTDVTTYTDHNNPDNRTFYYTVTAVDRLYNESGTSNVTDYEPPSITCPENQTLTLNTSCAAVLPDYRSLAKVSDDVSAPADITVTQMPAAGTHISGIGNTTITLTATDGSGKTASCNFTITAEDKIPPVITNVSVDPPTLFPVNHVMRNVTVSYSALDNCGSVNTSLSVTSNEPETGLEKDWEIVDNQHLKLRAERKGYGKGREYVITITATDASGNQSTEMIKVIVPHDYADLITSAQTADGALEPAVQKELDVWVLTNPSVNHFTILTKSVNKEALQIRVIDNANRLVEIRKGIAANGTLHIGNNYVPGIYYMEVKQGNKQVSLKLIKQK